MADTKQKTIFVKQSFVLTKDDGEKVPFPAGRHSVDADVADHWFVKLHLGDEADLPAPDQDLVQVAEAEIEQLKEQLASEKTAREAAEARVKELDKQVADQAAEIEQLKKKGK